MVQVPGHAQPLAQAQLLDGRVALEQRNFVGEAHQAAAVGHERAEQFRQVLQRALGARRIAPDQRQHRVQAVEQEMRADARLQRLQPRLGQRRRVGAQVQRQVGEHERHACRGVEQGARKRHLGVLTERRVRARGKRQHQNGDHRAGRRESEAAQQRRGGVEQREAHQQQRLEQHRAAHEDIEHAGADRLRYEGDGEREQVDEHQRARHDAQIAEIRQRGCREVLPYTDHR